MLLLLSCFYLLHHLAKGRSCSCFMTCCGLSCAGFCIGSQLLLIIGQLGAAATAAATAAASAAAAAGGGTHSLLL
jgi:hypothetical protein